MITSPIKRRSTAATAATVRFSAGRMLVRLNDAREISVPLEWFPKLRDASAKERKNWRLIGCGVGIHWNDLDEDISVAGLLQGERSHSKEPSKH